MHLYLTITHKTYIYKAIIYQIPEIDDSTIFYNRTIARASYAQPWPISKQYNKIQLSSSLSSELKSLRTSALLMIKNDSICFEQYDEYSNEQTQTGSFSVAKSFVSTLIGIALNKGYIKSLDEPLANYLPEFNTPEKRAITIRHCLMMSSGLSWDEAYASAFSITTEAYYGKDLRGTVNRLNAIEKPGKTFKYKSGDTQILSLVLAKATGMSTSVFMSKYLWSKIGSEQDARWSLDHEQGVEKAYCCIYASARDFARLGKLYLHHGKWNNEQVVDSAYINQATTPNQLTDTSTHKPNQIYGFQWWIYPTPTHQKVFYARGILGQYIIVIPHKNLVVVRLGHQRGEKINNQPSELIHLIDYLLNEKAI